MVSITQIQLHFLLAGIFFAIFETFCTQGPVITYASSPLSNGRTSMYGEWIMVSSGSFIQIYENNRIEFLQTYTVAATSPILDFHSPENLSLITILTTANIEIHKMNEAGAYILTQSLYPQTSEIFTDVLISDDSTHLYVGSSFGVIQIFTLNASSDYELDQIHTDSLLPIRTLVRTQNLLISGGDEAVFRVYQESQSGHQLIQTVLTGITMIKSISASSSKILVLGDNKVELYIHNGNQYIAYMNLDTFTMVNVHTATPSYDFSHIIVGGDTNLTYFYFFADGNYAWFQEVISSSTPLFTAIDYYGVYYIVGDVAGNVQTHFYCIHQCTTCVFPNNCTSCADGLYLENDWCFSDEEKPTMCFKEEMYENGICHEYCSRECENCVSSTSDCGQCSEFYTKNEDGECVIENDVIRVVALTRPLVNVVRRGGLNLLFFALDDLWLYQFHSRPYDGVLKQVFGMIRLVEERQWEIIGLDEFKDSLESAEVLQVYNRFSNRKYLQKERKSNVFLASTIPYFVFFVPWTLVLVCLCNRLFYALFHCRVSKYLRPYSLWWVLLELLLQNNVEYFTFLGCRALDIPFSFSFQSRCLFLLSALMLLLTCFTAFSSYIIYYSVYQKLASYFLVNMYRLQSSFTLMTISYGLKPMVKGLVHALFYDHFSLQLHLLLLAELAGLLTTLLFEHAYGNHKSKSLLALEVLYSSSFVCLNALILFKMVYFPDFPTITTEVEFLTQITVYVMAATLALRILADIILLISCWEWCREQEQNSQQFPQKKREISNIFTEQQKTNNNTIVIKINTNELNDEENIILQYFLQKQRKKKQQQKKDQL